MAADGYAPIRIWGVRFDGSCTCGDPGDECYAGSPGKHPVGKGWQHAPIDAAACDAWFAFGGNIGWRMGTQPNGQRLIAIDEDSPGAIAQAETSLGPLPRTLASRSGSGHGGHRVLLWPADKATPRNRVKALPGIDIRSEGGQIVMAPSRHKSGGVYVWTVIAPIAEMPAAWCEALLVGGAHTLAGARKSSKQKYEPTGDPLRDAMARRNLFRPTPCPRGVAPIDHAVKICGTHEPAVEGDDGHGTLLSLARALVWGLKIEPTDAADLAWSTYNPRCAPPWTDDERRDFDRKFVEASKPFADLEPGYLLPGARKRTKTANDIWVERMCRLHAEIHGYEYRSDP